MSSCTQPRVRPKNQCSCCWIAYLRLGAWGQRGEWRPLDRCAPSFLMKDLRFRNTRSSSWRNQLLSNTTHMRVAVPLGNTNPRLSHASDRLDPSYTRTCTCTRQRPRARLRALASFPGETLSLQRCVTLLGVTLQRLLACTRAWYQSSAISVTFRTLSRDPRGDLQKVPREGGFETTFKPSKATWAVQYTPQPSEIVSQLRCTSR